METLTYSVRPPPAAGYSADPILEIMNDADLTLGEKLLLMEALLVHDSTPVPRLGRGAGRARRRSYSGAGV